MLGRVLPRQWRGAATGLALLTGLWAAGAVPAAAETNSPAAIDAVATTGARATAAAAAPPTRPGPATGDAGVDPNGSLTLSVPVPAPPGIGDSSPSLSLAYSSGASTGFLGVGWKLGGASQVQRCPAIMAVDGFRGTVAFNANDRFCLDGARLVNISGSYGAANSEYRTEIETWRRVVANGTCGSGPCGFTIQERDGTTLVYGGTADSRAMAGSSVRAWMLSSRTDANGNIEQYSYVDDAGSPALSRIDYGGNPGQGAATNRSVAFAYETRPDPVSNYVGGYRYGQTQRLATITTQLQGQTVSTFALTYATSAATGRSLLVSAQRCSPTQCYAPDSVGWQGEQAPSFTQAPLTLGQGVAASSSLQLQPADLNGDGYGDLVAVDTGSTLTVTPMIFNKVSSFDSCGKLTLPAADPQRLKNGDFNADGIGDFALLADAGQLLSATVEIGQRGTCDYSQTQSATLNIPARPQTLWSADVNGDGRSDIVAAYKATNGLDLQVMLSAGTTLAAPVESSLILSQCASGPTCVTRDFLADINGDGMEDFVRFTADGRALPLFYVALSTGTGFAAPIETSLTNMPTSGLVGTWPLDANRDGLADLVVGATGPNGVLTLTPFFSNGTGTMVAGTTTTTESLVNNTLYVGPVDTTGSGAPILLQIRATQPTATAIAFNPIAGVFDTGSEISTGFASVAGAPTFAMDFSGDGKADLVQLTNSAGLMQIAGLLNAGPPADLVASATSSAGGLMQVDYAPLSNTNVYSTDWAQPGATTNAMAYAFRVAPGSEPYQRVSGGVRSVVQGLTRKSAPGTTLGAYSYVERYSYRNGLIDLDGRGWLGFEQVQRTQPDMGQITQTHYGQAFPLTGQSVAVVQLCDKASSQDPKCIAAADPTLNKTTNNYVPTQTATGVSGTKVWYPELRKVTIQGYYYGQPDLTRERDYDYDDYGNPVMLADVGLTAPAPRAGTANDVYTCQLYENRATGGQWQLGLLTARKVAASSACDPSSPFAAGDFHQERWTFDAAGNARSYAIWDDGNAAFLTSSMGYDGYGNQTSVTLPGGTSNTISYDATFHTYPLLNSDVPSGSGTTLTTTLAYDPRFGSQVGTISPNGGVFVTCLDDLGVAAASQGPPPGAGTWTYSPNCLGTSTGPASMGSAQLITVSTISRSVDQGLSRVQTQSLERWPTPSVAADFMWRAVYYDGLGRAFITKAEDLTHSAGAVVCMVLDAEGNATRTSAPAFSGPTTCDSASPSGVVWATQTLDAYGRPLLQVMNSTALEQAASQVAFDYQPGLTATVNRGSPSQTLAQVVTTAGYFNGRRKIVSTANPDGSAKTQFEYDPTGELVRIVEPATASNPAGIVSTIDYDSVGRQVRVDNPDQNSAAPNGEALVKAYSSNALLGTSTDAMGRVTSFTYDGQRRPLTKTDPDYVVTYGYDSTAVSNGLGHLTSVTMTTAAGAPVYSESFAYDPYGNIVQRALTLGSESFALKRDYDPQGNITQETFPDGSVVTRSFTAGMASAATGPGGLTLGFQSYSPLRLPETINLGSAITSTSRWSSAATLVGLSVSGAGGAKLLDDRLSWDGTMNLQSIADQLKPGGTDYSENYGYANGRLVSAAAPGTYGNMAYGYDDNGNLTSVDGLARSYTAHRVTSLTNSSGPATTIAYNDVGDVRSATTGSAAITYDFDARNQLVQVAGPSGPAYRNPVFADDGRRLQKMSADGVVTLYPFANYEVVRTPGLAEVRKTYLTVGGVIYGAASSSGTDPAQALYFQNNQIGSSALVLDAAGNLVTRFVYRPYGLASDPGAGAEPGERRFQAHEWDEAPNIYYFGARFYDPTLGRFLSADDQTADDLYTRDALNRYALSTNNPVTLTDPTGHSVWDNIAGAIIGVAEIAAGIAIDVLSDGALEPLGQGLVGAGIGGLQYSVTAGSNYSWRDYGDQELVGFVLGVVTGGLGDAGLAGEGAVDVVEDSSASITQAVADDVAEDSAGEAVATDASNAGDEAAMESSASEDAAEDETCALASLPAGMTVRTPFGLRDIALLGVGEPVYAGNAIDRQARPRAIDALLGRDVTALVALTVRAGGSDETLYLTPNHPVALIDGRWAAAATLTPGMHLIGANGAVEVVAAQTQSLDQPVQVYNIALGPEHSYYVGNSGIWVHNPCRATKKSGTSPQGDQYDVVLEVPEDEYPESAQHITDAQKAGHDDVLTVDRSGARANRRDSLRGWKTQKGFDRDEYPPAMFAEGGTGADIEYIDPADNRGSGSSFGGQLRGFADGTRVWFKVVASTK
jgi:RHS repeat-associated protein